MLKALKSIDSNSADRFKKSSPGPQHTLRESRAGIWIFRLLFSAIFLIIAYSVIQAQLTIEQLQHPFWQLHLLDSGEALTLLVALVALFYTRKQLIDGLLPYVVYEGKALVKSQLLTPELNGKTFIITLKNIGNGSAIIKNVNYHLSLKGNVSLSIPHDEVLRILKSNNLEFGKDYVFTSIGNGFGLAKDNTINLFEINQDRWWEIDHLDMTIDFRGTAGSLYRKEIFLIPRDRDARFGNKEEEK